VKTTFTIGMYIQRKGAEQTWTALVPEAHATSVNGSNETRLREQMVERLRDQLRSAHPGIHERFHLHAGTRLERVHLDVAVRDGNDTQRLSGTFPLVCVPRWIDDARQRLICFHPLLPDRWFAAVDADEVASLAPHFARTAWASKINLAEALKATGKERLGLVELAADARSLLDEVREKPGRQRASSSRSMEAVLTKLGVDLTAQAVNGTLSMGAPREPYRAQLGRLLGGTKLRSTVLVGRPGVGKRTLIARWIGDRLDEDGFALHRNLDKIHHVWRLSGKRLIAGMSYLGDWEKRCLALADEARRTKAILWLDDLHLFGRIGQSRQSERSLADFFRGPIGRGELTVVSALTTEQLQRLEDDAPALASLLVRLPVQAASTKETHELLLAEIRELEQRLGVDLHPFVPRTVIELGAALFPWTALPGSAIELVRKVSEANAPAVGRKEVGAPEVIRHLARTTGLAERLLTLDEPLLAAEVEAAFALRVMGQPEALAAATDVVMKVRAGVADPARPLGVYLFTGPTGTGKTELATALAQYLYGDISRLVRLDMSELSGPDAPARLIGDRVQPEGLLTQRIREQPFSVVLLDEIEKAHPSVLSLLLQLFDEGRLTDAAGNAASFQHAVVVMTSNLGARQQAPIGFGDHEAAVLAEVSRAVREFFPPELWNRIDRVVPFRPLSAATAERIVDKELARVLARRGLGERSVFVYASAAVKARAVAEAFDPRYGARTVKRWLEDQVASRLADELARGGGAKMRVIRLLIDPKGAAPPPSGRSPEGTHPARLASLVDAGAVALDVEPLTEAPAVPGPFTLEPLLERAAVALEPHAAAEARALATAASGAVFARGPREAGDRAGELMWAMDRAATRLRALASLLGGDLALARVRDRDDDRGAAPKRRRALDRDTALAGIAEGLLLRRRLDQLRDPDAHVVTLSLTRVGHARRPDAGRATADVGQPGTLSWMTNLFLGGRWLDDAATWFDVGAARRLDGKVITFATEARPGDVPLDVVTATPCSHVVLVLRDAMITPALRDEHGSHVFRSLAGEPEIVRVEVTRGAVDPRAVVVEHARRLAAFDAAVDAGGEIPVNPEKILPVVRTVGWRAPLRAGEAYHVDLEDFATGWSSALDVASLDDAIRQAWWLRWSAS